MNKAAFILISLVLILSACGGRTGEASRTEAELKTAIYNRELEIIDLQKHIAILEIQREEFDARLYDQASAQAEILNCFLQNLDWIAEFLGVQELYIPAENTTISGNFVEAHGRGDIYNISVILHRVAWRDEYIWELLSYNVNHVGGSAMPDGGRSAWRWEQYYLFDESFTVRFFSFIDNWPLTYSYSDEEILPHNWQAQIIDHMKAHTNIQIAHLWYESYHNGKRLVVDLTPAAAVQFNWGTTGSYLRGRTLIDSMLTLPNVTELEILVGGQRGFSADHFCFARVFRVR